MLEPESRVVLLDQLRPPPGFKFDAAVATTYSLSLSAALVPHMAFTSPETPAPTDPVSLLAAIDKCADNLDIFYQPGQVEVPQTATDLMSFLEQTVHAVRPPPKGYLFHPKLWFVRYTSEDESPRYRLLCSSRNLVTSNAWDLAVTLEGVPGKTRKHSNGDLARLLRWLPSNTVTQLSDRRIERINNLADEATRVEWDLPADVDRIHTHVWGLGKRPRADFRGTKHLVIAPFIDERGLRLLTPGSSSITIVSRSEALNAIPSDQLARATGNGERIYVLDSAANTSEDRDDGVLHDDIATERDGLHAKLVIAQRNYRAHVFVGSPNATERAYEGNIELAIELEGKASRLGVRKTIGDDSPLRAFLEEYDGREESPETDDSVRRLKNALRRLASIPMTLTVRKDGQAHKLTLEISSANAGTREPTIPTGMTADVYLLTQPGIGLPLNYSSTQCAVFKNVGLTDITPFVVLQLSDGEDVVKSVVHAPLIGDPAKRRDEILNRQIDTTEKLIRFLILLLGSADGIDSWMLLNSVQNLDEPGRRNGRFTEHSGVLEILVHAFARDPARIDHADAKIRTLFRTNNKPIRELEGFEDLWFNLQEARRKLRRTQR